MKRDFLNTPSAMTARKRLLDASEKYNGETIIQIPCDKIKENPLNIGIPMDDIDELAQSIQDLGLLEPLIVYEADADGNFEIIGGHRRFRAISEILKWDTAPCIKKKRPEDARTQFRLHADSNVQTRQHSVRYWIAEINHAEELLDSEGFSGSKDERTQAISSLLGNAMSSAQIYRIKGVAKMAPEMINLDKYQLSAKALYTAVSLPIESQKKLAKTVVEYMQKQMADDATMPNNVFAAMVKKAKSGDSKPKRKARQPKQPEKPEKLDYISEIKNAEETLYNALQDASSPDMIRQAMEEILQIKYKIRQIEDTLRARTWKL